MDFKSIESEQWREYVFPNAVVRIEAPKTLNVSASGGHRIEDCQGMAHYVPPGWVHLRWLVREGAPVFSF